MKLSFWNYKVAIISAADALITVAGSPSMKTDDGYCNRFLPISAWQESTGFISAQVGGQTAALMSIVSNQVGKVFFLDKEVADGRVQEICILMLKKAMKILNNPVFFNDNLALALHEAYNTLSDSEKQEFPSIKELLIEERLKRNKERKEQEILAEQERKKRELFVGRKGKKRELSKWFSL